MIGDKANGCRTLHLEPLFQPGFPHWYGLHLEPFPKCRIYAIPKAFWKKILGSKWLSGTIYIYTHTSIITMHCLIHRYIALYHIQTYISRGVHVSPFRRPTSSMPPNGRSPKSSQPTTGRSQMEPYIIMVIENDTNKNGNDNDTYSYIYIYTYT